MKNFGFKSTLMASAIALSTLISPLEAVWTEEQSLEFAGILDELKKEKSELGSESGLSERLCK